MEKVLSLAESLLTLIVVIRFIALVFGGGGRVAGASQPEASNPQMAALEVNNDEAPGSPGRWNSSLERNQYYRARGSVATGME